MQAAKNNRRLTLLRTAEALFASKGIDAVSLNEINKAAGQKNTSAMHYYFGSKEKLIETIIYEEFEGIVEHLNSGFDELEARQSYTGRDLINAVMSPFVAMLDDERGTNYLHIIAQLLNRKANMPFRDDQPKPVEAVKARAFALAQQFYADLPDEVKITRLIMFGTLLFRSLVSYAQFDEDGTENILGEKNLFVNVLAEALEQVIFAPMSEPTRQCLSKKHQG